MRIIRNPLVGVLLVVLAACGGGPASASVEESTGGRVMASLDELEDALVVPNATNISRRKTAQGLLVSFDSATPAIALQDYYHSTVRELGMDIITSLDSNETWAIAFGIEAAGTGLGGTISCVPAGDVRNVVVTLAKSS
jgi:hypothetical protein